MRSSKVGFFGRSLRKNITFIIEIARRAKGPECYNCALVPRGILHNAAGNSGENKMRKSTSLRFALWLLAAPLAWSATPAGNAYLVHNLVSDQPGNADFTDPN